MMFGNLCAGLVGYGYMDAAMDWRMVLRDEAQMQSLVDSLPQAGIARARVMTSRNQAALFALVEKHWPSLPSDRLPARL